MHIGTLAARFGDRVQVRGDAAGMHVLVRFKDPEMARKATAAKVQLVSSSAYYLTDPPLGEFVLGFSSIGERSIREGIRRLAIR